MCLAPCCAVFEIFGTILVSLNAVEAGLGCLPRMSGVDLLALVGP